MSEDFHKAIAQERYEDALKLLPDTPDAAVWRCFVLFKLGKSGDAVGYARTVMTEQKLDDAVARGIVEQVARKASPNLAREVISDYTNRSGGSNDFTRVMLAFVDSRLGNLRPLEALAREFAAKKVQNPMLALIIYQEMVLPAYRRKDFDGALSSFEQVYKIDSRKRLDPDYMIEWAVISKGAGRYTEALKKLNEVQSKFGATLDSTRKAWVAELRGDIFVNTQDYSSALEEYENLSNLVVHGNEVARAFFEGDLHEILEAKRHRIDRPGRKGVDTRLAFLLFFALTAAALAAFLILKRCRKEAS